MHYNLSYRGWLVVLICLAICLLFLGLSWAPIYILDEAKNAQCAREMWETNNWLVPTFNGALRTDKPPLHYWFMGISYSIFGYGAGAARFFSGIMGLATLLLCYWWVRKWLGVPTALLSILSLVLSVHFIFEFRLAVPDPYLIFFTTAGLVFGYCYVEQLRFKWLLLASISLALAVLSKGPVAIALPGMVLLGFTIWQKKWVVLKDWRLLIALAVLLAIALPWYILVHQATMGEYTKGFFFEHNLNRFSSEMEGHGGPFFITPLIVMIGMLPLSPLLIECFRPVNGYFKLPVFRFALLVVITYVLFFSISSTKLPNYPMPCYPFVAAILGIYLKDIMTGQKKLPAYIWYCWLFFALLLPVAAYFGIKAESAVAQYAWLAYLLGILPLGATLGFNLYKQNRLKGLKIAGASWLLFGLIFMGVGYPLLYRQNPVSKLLPFINGNTLVAYKAYNPAFNFNLPFKAHQIPVYKDTIALKQAIVGFSKNDFSSVGRPIYIVTRLDYLIDLQGVGLVEVARYRDLFELPTTVLLEFKQ